MKIVIDKSHYSIVDLANVSHLNDDTQFMCASMKNNQFITIKHREDFNRIARYLEKKEVVNDVNMKAVLELWREVTRMELFLSTYADTHKIHFQFILSHMTDLANKLNLNHLLCNAPSDQIGAISDELRKEHNE